MGTCISFSAMKNNSSKCSENWESFAVSLSQWEAKGRTVFAHLCFTRISFFWVFSALFDKHTLPGCSDYNTLPRGHFAVPFESLNLQDLESRGFLAANTWIKNLVLSRRQGETWFGIQLVCLSVCVLVHLSFFFRL